MIFAFPSKTQLVLWFFVVSTLLFLSFAFTLGGVISRKPSLRGKARNFSKPNLKSASEIMTSTPKIIYGTAWKKERTKELVALAVRTGFRAIDTACQPKHYFELGVGQALEELYASGTVSREDMFIQTKYTAVRGQDPNNIPYDKNRPLQEQVWESFNVSCQNLRTTYLDSLVMHSPMGRMSDTLLVWKTFEEIYKSGGVKRLGLSNTYDLETLQGVYEAAEIKPSVIQNRFYRESGYDVEIRAFCKEKGIMYQSFWTLTANPHILKHRAVTSLAAKYGKTREQIFFKFVQSLGITPLSGTTSEQHMREDLEAVSAAFTLQEEEIKQIQQLLV